ncbi:MAG: ATP synthase F1 subunit epsilon [Thermaerobacter sp.]|nr:ATP synthase F1 subunit epsilon [Thermaerobacter sp.]
MATPYRLKVVTPEETVYDQSAVMIVVRSTEGEIGIMAHHMRIITPLLPHIMAVYQENGPIQQFSVGGGFLEVGDEQTVVLADSAETAARIDVARAERAQQRALERLATGAPNIDLKRAQRALARAENRLKLAGRLDRAVASTR